MNLLLVDDHALFREALRMLLEHRYAGVCIQEADNVERAVAACRNTGFDIVLLDLTLPESGGIDTLNAFRKALPDVSVVVLSGDRDTRHIRATIDNGAKGFIPKAYSSDLMVSALKFVMAGKVYCPQEVLDGEDARQVDAMRAIGRLTSREQEVAELLFTGRPYKEIARQLEITESTIKTHARKIFNSLGVNNRFEAFIIAAKYGLHVM